MKRSPLQRKTPLRPKPPERKTAKVYEVHTPRAHAECTRELRMADTRARATVQVPKVDAVRSEEYRRLVAARPCINCGAWGRSQAAHPNTGKAMGKKTDDRLCFPLCGPSFSELGCHAAFDQGVMLTKEARRAVEPEWGKSTRDGIRADGLWPKGLPEWKEV